MSQPSIFLSNWSSHSTVGHHGPGRKLSGMALPRSWEHGDGEVKDVAPDPELLRAVQDGQLSIRDYLLAYEARLAQVDLRHPHLRATLTSGWLPLFVRDGDSILCACAARKFDPLAILFGLQDHSRHPCHLEVLAPAMALAGWRVVLYGVPLEVEGGVVYQGPKPYRWDPL